MKFDYTKLWQIDTVWQDVDGATFSGGTPDVQYVYDDNAVADGNWSRVVKTIYPNGEEYDYYYGTTSDSHSAISRVWKVQEDTGGLSSVDYAIYDYIGLGMVAKVDLAQPDVQLDYQVKHEGDRDAGEYAGFDRFGRVIHHPWVDGNFTTHATNTTVPNIPPIVELDYAYDKASNRTKMLDGRPARQPACSTICKRTLEG